MPLFTEIAIAVVLAAVLGFIAHLLRQPPIIGFILAGLIAGFLSGRFLGATEIIEGLAPIGVALLLFLVGLELDIKDIRRVGLPALLTGLGQIAFTFGIGYLIATSLGFATLPALYISIALTFSSTIIIIKLLSEKKDLNSLYGRIVVGFLLVQDFVAIIVLVLLAGVQGEGATILGSTLTLAKGGALVAATFVGSRFLPNLLDKVGRSQEMLYLFSISWALGIAALTEAIGLSIEVGGFLAGLALANSSEHFQIGSRMRPIRDFFLILFFIGLGAQMLVGVDTVPVGPAIIFSLFVLIGNPILVMVVMGALGYRSRTSFLASLTVAQISEFSLIIAALGLCLGHIDHPHVSLITLVGIITIFTSSYLILYGEKIFKLLKPILRVFEFRKKLVEERKEPEPLRGHTVLVGAHRTGGSILEVLRAANNKFLVVEFDPVIVKELEGEGVPVIYGDITDEEIQELANIREAKTIISTVPHKEDNEALLSALRKNIEGKQVIVSSQSPEEAKDLYKLGATYVIMPNFVGGWELAQAIGGGGDLGGLLKLQERDVKVLDLRRPPHQ